MAFDFKKEYKDLYQPGTKPAIIDVPEMNFIAVRGAGDPNEPEGEYKRAVGVLYAVAYTLKMSYKTERKISGFFEGCFSSCTKIHPFSPKTAGISDTCIVWIFGKKSTGVCEYFVSFL